MLRTLYHRVFGETVFSGPFRGLRYIPNSVGSVHLAKLIGTYECEVRPQIERLIARAPDVFVNIGAAEGYYAVGVAARLPAVRVVAFETEPHGRDLIQRLAARNDVAARIEIHGTATPENLALALRGARRPCVMIDAEGAEDRILDPILVPDLSQCDMLVEAHDFVAPIGARLSGRFAGTHKHEEVWSHPRRVADLPGAIRLAGWTPWRNQILKALDEQRPGPMRWFWFESISRQS